jgi:hypothetical protein
MRHAVPSDPRTLDAEDFDLVMYCVDVVLKHRAYASVRGGLVVFLCKFRDDVRDAHGKEMLSRVERGSQILPLKELDPSELDTLAEAVDTLLLQFGEFIDEPELTDVLAGFRSSLRVEKGLQEKARNGATANAEAAG